MVLSVKGETIAFLTKKIIIFIEWTQLCIFLDFLSITVSTQERFTQGMFETCQQAHLSLFQIGKDNVPLCEECACVC